MTNSYVGINLLLVGASPLIIDNSKNIVIAIFFTDESNEACSALASTLVCN